jgi:hypothetical protein
MGSLPIGLEAVATGASTITGARDEISREVGISREDGSAGGILRGDDSAAGTSLAETSLRVVRLEGVVRFVGFAIGAASSLATRSAGNEDLLAPKFSARAMRGVLVGSFIRFFHPLSSLLLCDDFDGVLDERAVFEAVLEVTGRSVGRSCSTRSASPNGPWRREVGCEAAGELFGTFAERSTSDENGSNDCFGDGCLCVVAGLALRVVCTALLWVKGGAGSRMFVGVGAGSGEPSRLRRKLSKRWPMVGERP